MKKTLLSLAIASLATGQSVCAAVEKVYNEPDSVYIFSYAHPEDEGRSGLKFAWSPDGDKWLSVSDGFAYLKCDFGRWGSEKRMIKPLLEKAEDGRWYCRWQLTPSGKVWGTSHSSDLLKWAPQQYVNAEKPAVPRLVTARQIVLDKDTLNGYMQKVPYVDIEQLIRFAEHKKFRDIQNNERTEQDAVRFAGLKPVTATIRVDAGRVKPISEHLIGIFFEDINYGADGGLYAELVQNRDFEYSAKDGARDKNWNSTYAWSIQGTNAELSVSEDSPIHANNAHYAVLEVHRPGAALVNNGFDGIAVKKGEKYDFSVFSKVLDDTKGGKVLVRLTTKDGKEIAQAAIRVSSTEWEKQKAVLTATADAADADNYIFSRLKNKQSSYTPSLDLYYQRTLPKNQMLTMSVTGTLMHTDNNRLYHEYTPQAEDLAMIETDVTGNKRSIIGEAIYDKRFKFLVFSAGLRHYQMYARNEYAGSSPVVSEMNQAKTAALSAFSVSAGKPGRNTMRKFRSVQMLSLNAMTI